MQEIGEDDVIINEYGDYEEEIKRDKRKIIEDLKSILIEKGEREIYEENEKIIEKEIGSEIEKKYGKIGIMNE